MQAAKKTQQKSQREAVSGVLLLNKPLGLSSNQALKKVQLLLKAKKGGHTGNLDPKATGLLPLCFGEATKMASFGLEANKTYQATLQLGFTTTTGDAEGELLASYPVPKLSQTAVEEVLASFLGKQQQIPPMYSALKHQGRKLYELARQGEEIDRPPRPIEVFSLELNNLTETSLSFSVSCSKGTYIRVLGEDIATKLGSGGHLTALHRTEIDGVNNQQQLEFEALINLEASQGVEAIRKLLLPNDYLVKHLAAVNLSAEEGQRILHGQRLKLLDVKALAGQNVRLFAPLGENSALVFIGLGLLEAQTTGCRLQPVKVLNL